MKKVKNKWNGCTPFYKGMIGINKGKKSSLETREKLSISHMGKPGYWTGKTRHTPWMNGKNNPLYKNGKKLCVCLNCGNEFLSYNKLYCNLKCYHSYRGKMFKISGTREYRKIHSKKNKAMRKSAGHLSAKTLQIVYENNIKKYSTLTCYLCLNPILFGEDSLEHKTPICRGGNNNVENLDIAHIKCNQMKHSMTENEYRLKLKEVKCLVQ